ncbi:MAG: hypothetical protein A3J38_03250 [Gammaproteobacteria bacterium RIFCSPHIGHO2_12_FULL_45_9]|nr:MAG: hypothetical protein A3J38_03250 [Gammaproteobacteria bacterium RIFCSPHIGHO2_12_FULL_45_9]
MIQLQQVTLRLGTKTLLDHADLLIEAGQKIGLIGPNGAGKSSLFKVLLHEHQIDQGELVLPKQKIWAHIRQEIPDADLRLSTVDYALQGDSIYQEIMTALTAAEAQDDGEAQMHCHMRLADIDGYAAPARAAKVLLGLGFQQADLTRTVDEFSGGWQMRLNLAQVLLSNADILLLDEPTNHLDLEAIFWLGEWLSTCPATLLVISHDREFLDEVTSHIVFITNQKLKKYTGNYSSFEHQYAESLVLQQKAYEKQQKHKAHLQSFVDRFRAKASKAKQAQSRMKMLNRLEDIAAVSATSPFTFEFSEPISAGNPVITLSHVDVGYDHKPVLSNVRFSLQENARIGLLGLNGAGKSTFVKLLAGELKPLAGEIVNSSKLNIGYFAQHQLELLDYTASPITHLLRAQKKMTEQRARAYLGSFNFQGDQAFETVAHFSGGEKARLVLALIIAHNPNLLLLDEPTNHLDMEMREALSLALQTYTGAVIVVSHDRFLLNSVADELWLVHQGQVSPFDGDLNAYRQWQKEQASLSEKKKPQPAALQSASKKSTPARTLQQLEKQLAASEAELKTLHARMAEPTFYQTTDAKTVADCVQHEKTLTETIAQLETEILKAL